MFSCFLVVLDGGRWANDGPHSNYAGLADRHLLQVSMDHHIVVDHGLTNPIQSAVSLGPLNAPYLSADSNGFAWVAPQSMKLGSFGCENACPRLSVLGAIEIDCLPSQVYDIPPPPNE